MDFKKAYEAALERARAGKPINEVFPELKESEDERIRSFLYEFIKVCGWSEKQYPPREKCLAYLERQKEQQPAEWSKEDELHLKNAILSAEKEWGAGSRTAEFLKSLRPAWKPSEEQMEVLKNVAFGSYQNGDGPILRKLYNDLAKL